MSLDFTFCIFHFRSCLAGCSFVCITNPTLKTGLNSRISMRTISYYYTVMCKNFRLFFLRIISSLFLSKPEPREICIQVMVWIYRMKRHLKNIRIMLFILHMCFLEALSNYLVGKILDSFDCKSDDHLWMFRLKSYVIKIPLDFTFEKKRINDVDENFCTPL